MSMKFFFRRVDDQSVEDASLTDPHNPFLIAAYMRAQRALGVDCWLLGIEDAGVIHAAALGLLRRGRLLKSLDIPSAPGVDAESIFWSGLEEFCQEERVTNLEISTFASPRASIPILRSDEERTQRTEFVLPLSGRDLFAELSSHHRARVKKARKSGMTMRRAVSDEALDAHLALQENSMARRRARHEVVPLEFAKADDAVLLANGAGELYQSMLNGQVASSILVLRSSRGAYFASGGSSSDGMRVGASHFLVHETAVALQSEGVELFFLGGARQHEVGLREFKSGFGAMPVDTEAVVAYVGSPLRRRVSAAVSAIQRAVTPRSTMAVPAPKV